MSKFEQIQAFIQVVEANSFASAAKKLGISTPAVSRQINTLEKKLNVQLLQRTTRSVTLTDIGMQYYEQCKKTLEELLEAEHGMLASQREASGTLTVMCNRYFALYHLIPGLQDFMAHNPKLRIKFNLAERYPDFIQENIDILFGVTMEGHADLARKHIGQTRYMLCAAPTYLEKHGMPHMPADLLKHAYITHSMRKPDNVLMFASGKEIFLEPILSLNDARSMRECAIQGLGIVRLHDYEVAEAIAKGELIEVLQQYKAPVYPLYLYYQQSRYLQPKIRRFIDYYAP